MTSGRNGVAVAYSREGKKMHDDLIVSKPPPKNRWEDCHDDDEQHFPAAALMIVYVLYLLGSLIGRGLRFS